MAGQNHDEEPESPSQTPTGETEGEPLGYAYEGQELVARLHSEHALEDMQDREAWTVIPGAALPEWEICIEAGGHDDDDPGESEWEHYHPTAETKEEAIEKAEDEATGVGLDSIVGVGDSYDVKNVDGPFAQDNATTATDSGRVGAVGSKEEIQ